MKPAVTLVLVNWNGLRFLQAFLPGVLATDEPPVEVLVVDNASTDNSLDWLRTHAPQVRILENTRNDGFARGNNLALPEVHTPWMLLLNTDVEVTPNWLAPLLACGEADPRIAAVQPKIRMHARKDHFEYAGAAGGYIDALGYAFCRGRIFDTLEPDTGQYDTPQDVFWASGACMLLRTAVVRKLGLFEESFFAHWEEIDFCWRAQNAGYRICVEPRSVVYHVGGGTLAQTHPRKTYLNFRNNLLCMARNLPRGAWFWRWPLRTLLDGLALIQFLIKGQWPQARAVVRAHLNLWRQLPRIRRQRRQLPRARPLHTLRGVYRGSVVLDYFARKRKKFSDLAPPPDGFLDANGQAIG